MDHSGIGMIEELNKSFQDRGIRVIVCTCWNFIKNTSTHLTIRYLYVSHFCFVLQLALANPRIRVVDKLVRSGVVDLIGAEWIFLTLKESVRACRFSLEQFSKQKGEHA